MGFTAIPKPASIPLPQGQGFAVSWADLGDESEGRTWIALCKADAGSLDLFSTMADDIRSTLQATRNADALIGLQAFLSRIRAWQEFMRWGTDKLLSPEAEVGLFGELEFLEMLIKAGIPAWQAVEAWQGPLDGLHDFPLGTGAIEVKSTVAPVGFTAKINSLEQLDCSLVNPLFVVGIRLSLRESGATIIERAEVLRTGLSQDEISLSGFNTRLIHAGLLDAHAGKYTRRFELVNHRLILITDSFPRLTAGSVAPAIRSARYELDLDLVEEAPLDIAQALMQTGVMY